MKTGENGRSPSYLPSAKLLFYLEEAEDLIASAAKATLFPRSLGEVISEMAEDKKENWLRELVARGHGSPLEHSIYVFEVVCSRVCSHQLVRHRHASYSQLSQRYSDKYLRSMAEKAAKTLSRECHSDELYQCYAKALRDLAEEASFDALLELVAESFIIPPKVIESRETGFLKSLLYSTASYYEALANRVSPEDARFLLPQAVKTRLVVSMNARELLEVFIPLRTCARAQWEIRTVAWQMLGQLVEKHPSIFKYAGPRCILSENRARTSPCTLEDFSSGKCSFTIERCPEGVPRNRVHECIYSSRLFK